MPSVILKGHKEGYEFILKDVSSFNEIKKEIDAYYSEWGAK